MTERLQRLNEIMRREANTMLHQRFPQEAVHIVICRVEVTPSLRDARIFFSVTDPQQQLSAESFLLRIRGELKHALAQRLQLRQFPEFHFKWDEKNEGEQRIYAILDALHGEENVPKNAPK